MATTGQVTSQCCPQTVQIVATIIQGIAILIALRIGRFFRTASLVIHNDVGSLTPVRILATNQPAQTYFYHGKVTAKFGSLKNARVYLIGASKRVTGDRLVESHFPVPHQLVWSPMEDHPASPGLDVNKERIFDFARLVGPPVNSSLQPRLYQDRAYIDYISVHANETVRWALQIDAEGYQSRVFYFELSWNGKWTDRPRK